jgi:hypothetical protein
MENLDLSDTDQGRGLAGSDSKLSSKHSTLPIFSFFHSFPRAIHRPRPLVTPSSHVNVNIEWEDNVSRAGKLNGVFVIFGELGGKSGQGCHERSDVVPYPHKLSSFFSTSARNNALDVSHAPSAMRPRSGKRPPSRLPKPRRQKMAARIPSTP